MPHSSFGDPLRAAREQAGLTIQDLANRTKIRGDYLRAMEDSDLSALPERTFTRGYVRRYAEELGLDPQPVVDEYDRAAPLKPEIARAMRGELAPRRRELPIAPLAAAVSGLLLVSAAGWWGYALWRSSAVAASEPAVVSVPLETDRQVALDVTSEPSGARVYLDNRDLGQTPITQFPVEARDSGELRVELSGYDTVKQDVRLDQPGRIAVTLQAQDPAADGGTQPTDQATAQATAAPAPTAAVTTSSAAQPPAVVTTTPATPPVSTQPSVSTPPSLSTSVEPDPKPQLKPEPQEAAKPATAGVTLRFTGRSWVRVTDANGRVLYEGIPEVGSSRNFPSDIRVRAGSAGAVQAGVNGAPLAPLGAAGQVVERRLP